MNINWQVAAAISEVIGAIAVVISLVYLAFQVRQNTRAIRGSTLDAITNHQQDELRWSAEMAPAWKKVFDGVEDELTFEESWAISEWLHAAFTARQNEYFQYRHGLLDREVWQASENIIRGLVGIEWVRKWWQEHGRMDRTEAFSRLVDGILEATARDVSTELGNTLK